MNENLKKIYDVLEVSDLYQNNNSLEQLGVQFKPKIEIKPISATWKFSTTTGDTEKNLNVVQAVIDTGESDLNRSRDFISDYSVNVSQMQRKANQVSPDENPIERLTFNYLSSNKRWLRIYGIPILRTAKFYINNDNINYTRHGNLWINQLSKVENIADFYILTVTVQCKTLYYGLASHDLIFLVDAQKATAFINAHPSNYQYLLALAVLDKFANDFEVSL